MDFNRYDLVDLTRQSLAKYANQIFLKIIQSYKSNNISQVTTLCECFLDLVNDLDMLLASHEGFLLGPCTRRRTRGTGNTFYLFKFLVLDGFILTFLMEAEAKRVKMLGTSLVLDHYEH